MKALACSNAGFDCNVVIKGDTIEEIVAQAVEHAVKEHNMKQEDTTSEDFQEQIRSLITTAF
jgi:predicted small metal-binding protein